MNSKQQHSISAEIDFDLVDWDSFIRRWMLYAARYIPGHRSIDARNAEDLVFQAINAVLSGRRHYARPNIFADSSEADHEAPFFVYICSVIRAISQSAYKVDRRFTQLQPSQCVDSSISYSTSGSYDNVLMGYFGAEEKTEEIGEISAFQRYLAQNSDDPLLGKIMDMVLNPEVSDMKAPQKAALLGVKISIFNNGIKRFKRHLDKFLEDQQGQ